MDACNCQKNFIIKLVGCDNTFLLHFPKLSNCSAFQVTELKEIDLPETVCLACKADSFIISFADIEELLIFNVFVMLTAVRNIENFFIFVFSLNFKISSALFKSFG